MQDGQIIIPALGQDDEAAGGVSGAVGVAPGGYLIRFGGSSMQGSDCDQQHNQ